jgi:Domain of unknown function (DUF4926)
MIQELDTVALTHDIQEYDLKQGDRGAVVHCYGDSEAFEVEFVDDDGQTTALLTLTSADIAKLTANDSRYSEVVAEASGDYTILKLPG